MQREERSIEYLCEQQPVAGEREREREEKVIRSTPTFCNSMPSSLIQVFIVNACPISNSVGVLKSFSAKGNPPTK